MHTSVCKQICVDIYRHIIKQMCVYIFIVTDIKTKSPQKIG